LHVFQSPFLGSLYCNHPALIEIVDQLVWASFLALAPKVPQYFRETMPIPILAISGTLVCVTQQIIYGLFLLTCIFSSSDGRWMDGRRGSTSNWPYTVTSMVPYTHNSSAISQGFLIAKNVAQASIIISVSLLSVESTSPTLSLHIPLTAV
jgi:hypothetical protein